MDEAEFDRFAERLSKRYFLLKRGAAFYFLGGAIAALAALLGVSVSSIRSLSETFFEEQISEDLAALQIELSQDVQALEHDIDRGRALLNEREARSRTAHARIVYGEDGARSVENEVSAGMAVILRGDVDGRAKSAALDHRHFVELCADLEGCSVEIAVFPKPASSLLGRSFLEIARSGGKCTLFYGEDSGVWSLDDQCTVWTQRLRFGQDGRPIIDDPPQGFSPYVPSTSVGIDGESSDQYQPAAVMGYSHWCFLSQSPHNPTGTSITVDREKGFFLTMAGTNWAGYREEYFPSQDPDRYCLLLIDD